MESREDFEEAVAQDPTFLAAAVWLAFTGANGAGCGLTDSIAEALTDRRRILTSFDRLTLDRSVAKCRNDWNEGFRLALEQAGLKPRSTYAVYTAGFFAVTSGRARVARDLLRSIDPERDLGWLPDSAKSIYWRDYTAAEHLLGEYRSEFRHAERQLRDFPSRLAIRMFAVRALAGLGRGQKALEHVEAALRLPEDSALRVAGGMTPGHLAYQAATELRVHGDSLASQAAARRAIEWYRTEPRRRLTAGRYERHYLARSLLLLDRVGEAAAVLADVSASDTNDVLYLALKGVLGARQGQLDAAAAADRQLAEQKDPALPGLILLQQARVALAVGDRAAAMDHVEQAAKSGPIIRSLLGNDIHVDPLLDGLRGNPRFERLVRGDR